MGNFMNPTLFLNLVILSMILNSGCSSKLKCSDFKEKGKGIITQCEEYDRSSLEDLEEQTKNIPNQ